MSSNRQLVEEGKQAYSQVSQPQLGVRPSEQNSTKVDLSVANEFGITRNLEQPKDEVVFSDMRLNLPTTSPAALPNGVVLPKQQVPTIQINPEIKSIPLPSPQQPQQSIPLPVNYNKPVIPTTNAVPIPNQKNQNQITPAPIKINTEPIPNLQNIQIQQSPIQINTQPIQINTEPIQILSNPQVNKNGKVNPMEMSMRTKKGNAAIPILIPPEELKKDAIIKDYSEAADMNYPKRRQMEDAHCENDPLYKYTGKDGKEHVVALYAVFDGHGGRYAALKAADIVAEHCEVQLKDKNFDTSEIFKLKNESEILTNEIKEIEKMEKEGNMENIEEKATKNEDLKTKHKNLEEAIKNLNNILFEAMKQVMIDMDAIIIGDRVDESGCCALVCIIDQCGEDKVVCMTNVGDSCGNIVVQDKGEFVGAIEMSVEHRAYKMNQEEIDRIQNLGGMIFNDRVNGTLAVSRALGDVNLKPYVSNEPFCQTIVCDKKIHKLVVLGCDGLWDYVTPSDIHIYINEYCKENLPFTDYGSRLIQQSKKNGSTDNISAVVLKLYDFNQ